MSFGGHLRALRGQSSLSRRELARRAGVPEATLRHWEGDRGMPGMPALFRLAEALGVPVEHFAEGVDDPAGDGPQDAPENAPEVSPGRGQDVTGGGKSVGA